jgi:3-hydroxybutyrate dehydrogenase
LEFTGKVVLITGSANGIGKEAARLFGNQGARLVLVDLNLNDLEAIAVELELDDYIAVAADVSKEEQVIHYVEAALDTYGRIDVFFNNAGILGNFRMITECSSDEFNAVLGVNLYGVFYGLKHVMKVMFDQGSGSIVNTSSTGGLKGSPGLVPYIASKHAVIGLTRTASLEAAEKGVRVNAICPGSVDTPLTRKVEEVKNINSKERSSSIPLKRYAHPAEIAQLVLFLSSDKASYITGAHYLVDGGKLS